MTKAKRKILIIGDFACSTGFANVNEQLALRLPPELWDVSVIGINATGDPHPMSRKFKVFPASLHGGDQFGVARTAGVAEALKPDLVLIHQDSWNVWGYIEALKKLGPELPPIIAWCPADAPNQWTVGDLMPDVNLIMAPTAFGAKELSLGGYKGRIEVLPYGIDRTLYTPGDRREARIALGFPENILDDIIFGRADRNAPRKRYDLTLKHFAQWWISKGKPDNVRLLFHCATTDPVGWNLDQLGGYYGLDAGRILLTQDNLHPGVLWPKDRVPLIYRSWDVHVSTSQGEGFGLIAGESAACGIAQMLPDYAAYGDLFRKDGLECAAFMRCTTTYVTPNAINTIGGVVDGGDLEWMFNHLYEDEGAREKYGKLALRAVDDQKFDWDVIAERFLHFAEEVLGGE